MIRPPPRSTRVRSSAASDVYKRQRRDTVGAGPLDELLALPDVTDVLVNGPGEGYVDGSGGLELTSVRFANDESVRRLAQRLATQGGRRLDDALSLIHISEPTRP